MVMVIARKTDQRICRLGTAFDRQKIDNLDESLVRAVAGFADGRDELQSRQKSIVTDTQQWAAECPDTVASTTIAAFPPSANRRYQSRLSWVTNPSSVARQGTIAGTQVRLSSASPSQS
jgi:hypothetical protein